MTTLPHAHIYGDAHCTCAKCNGSNPAYQPRPEPRTLNRQEALGLIEGAETSENPMAALLELQMHWIGHNDNGCDATAEILGQLLAEYVDECAAPRNDRAPRATDPTDLTAPTGWEV